MHRACIVALTATVGVLGWINSFALAAPIYYSQNFDALPTATINGKTDTDLTSTQTWSGSTTLDLVQLGVAVSGKALQVSSGPYRPEPFASPVGSHPYLAMPTSKQMFAFDYLQDKTIADPSFGPSSSLQNQVQLRGPEGFGPLYPNSVPIEAFLVYLGIKNGSGVVVQNTFDMRGATIGHLSPTVSANTWYHVEMSFDFIAKTAQAKVWTGNTLWWTSPTVTLGSNGNRNGLITGAGAGNLMYLDNLVTYVPEPVAVLPTLVGVTGTIVGSRRRR